MRDCKNCIYHKNGECSRWECEFISKKDCVILVGVSMPETCADCPFSSENIEGDDETGYGVWYECKFIDGGANQGEKLKDCPLQAESEEEE